MFDFYSCKKWCILALLSVLMLSVKSVSGQLIISQYYEGASYNKFVELTNIGDANVDLSQYKIGYWGKSGSSGTILITGDPSSKISLTGELAPKASMIIANSRYDAVTFPFSQVMTSGSLSFNGNDGVALLDAAGAILDMGPNGVSGANRSYWRNLSVTDVKANFDLTQWIQATNAAVKAAGATDPERLEYHLAGSIVISSDKAITSFIVNGKSASINESNHTLSLALFTETEVTALSPQIEISNKASISPTSGTTQNFTSPVTYTVTAEDASQQTYQVTVNLVDPPSSSLVINELDSDQTSTDTHEFIELYDGGSGNTSLDGYSLVLYNGSNDQSYLAYDLTGQSTNAEGFFVLGSDVVANVDLSPDGFNMQNGPDAVGLYNSAVSNFTYGTVLTTDNLIDIVVYDTSDADDAGLLAALTAGGQINENENGSKDTHSVYRTTDGEGGARNTTAFSVGIPTPGQTNTAIASAATIELSLSATSGTEVDQTVITLTATASKSVSGAQTLTYAVTGNQITAGDYTLSNTTITIPDNGTTGSVTFTVVDDSESEANETATLTISSYSSGLYPGATKSVEITLVDDDGSIAADYGTPVSPTYDKVSATIPANFYSAVENKSGTELRTNLQSVVVNATTKGQTYGDIWSILKEADENPENPNQVWLIYLEKGLDKSQQDGQVAGEVWNREHVWAQSLGGFSSGTSTSSNGKDVYFSTTADDLNHGHADGHHLRAAQKNENSSRGNKSFDDVSGARSSNTNFYEPPASAKGDVARSILYMEIRYNALNVIEGFGTSGSNSIGKLSTLLEWHKNDPVDDYEKHRNNKVYDWQNNRNPFIDYPQMVDYIWGDKTDQAWTSGGAPVKQAQTITFAELANKTFGDAAFDLSATSTSSLEVAFELVSGPATLSGKTLTMTGAGDIVLKATQVGSTNYLAASAITRTLTVDKKAQTLTFAELANKTFGDVAFDLSATSTSNLEVAFELVSGPATLAGKTLTMTGAGDVVLKGTQAGNANYLAASAITRTLTVDKKVQTLTFAELANKTFGDAAFDLSATSTSNLEVAFELVSGPATLAGKTLTMIGAGDVQIKATQAGNTNYLAATAVTRTLSVDKKAQTITFAELANKTFGDAAFDLSATSTSTFDVVFELVSGPATLSGKTVTMTGAGDVVLKATQVGSTNYLAASAITRTLAVDKKAQTITFAELANKTFGDVAFDLSATSTSNLEVAFELVSGAATLAGKTLTITGAGDVVIKASQVGDANHLAASAITRTLSVDKKAQIITFAELANMTFGDAAFDLSATSTSNLEVAFELLSGPATLSGNTLTITGAGALEIKATQVGNTNYSGAVAVTQTLIVNKADQLISFSGVNSVLLSSKTLNLNASSNSGLDIVYRVVKGNVTLSDGVLTLNALGEVIIEADQLGNVNYKPAVTASYTFNIVQNSQTLSFTAIDDFEFTKKNEVMLEASASSAKPVTFEILEGNGSIDGNTLSISGAGHFIIKAIQIGDDEHASVHLTREFDVQKTSQTITFAELANKTFGDAAFDLSATSTSGLEVAFELLSGSATLSGKTLTMTGAGDVVLKATQAGNTNYLAAAIVTRTLTVTKNAQTITFAELANKTFGDVAFDLSATTTSGLEVAFELLSGSATLSGNILTMTGAGDIVIKATQMGNTNYLAATTVTRTLTVNKNAQTINFAELVNKSLGDAAFDLSATSTSGLEVAFELLSGPATLSGKTLTITGAGDIIIKATQGGNANYLAADALTKTIIIAKASQILSFTKLDDREYRPESQGLMGSSSANLPLTYELVNGPATLVGSSLMINGVGAITVKATQAGNENYLAADPVVQTFTVSKASQIISFDAIPDRAFKNESYGLSASSNATHVLEVSFEVLSGPATLVGSSLMINGVGAITVKATQAGNDYFLAATPVEQTFTVSKASQIISFDAIPDRSFKNESYDLSASSDAGFDLKVSFELVSGPAQLIGSSLMINGAGDILVKAKQEGNANYLPAPEVTQSFVVSKAEQEITFAVFENKNFGDADFTLDATSSSSLEVNFELISGPATLIDKTISIIGAGDLVIKATQAGNTNYLAATTVTRTLTVNKKEQTITFAKLANKTFGDVAFDLSATSSSTLDVAFELVSGPATLAGKTLTMTGAGDVVIKAFNLGNVNYSAAEQTRTLVVLKADQTITFASIFDYIFGEKPLSLIASSSSLLAVEFEITQGVGEVDANVFTPTEIGQFTIRAYQEGDGNYNYAEAIQSFLVDRATGIDDVFVEEITMYPNPTTDYINIDFPSDKLKKIKILNMKGQLVKTAQAYQSLRLNIQDLKSGMYLIAIQNDETVLTKRLVKLNK